MKLSNLNVNRHNFSFALNWLGYCQSYFKNRFVIFIKLALLK